jgi:chromate transport protein ChrA
MCAKNLSPDDGNRFEKAVQVATQTAIEYELRVYRRRKLLIAAALCLLSFVVMSILAALMEGYMSRPNRGILIAALFGGLRYIIAIVILVSFIAMVSLLVEWFKSRR